ncbi:hypothetical protein SDC9_95637 [bioreactor metagenome]|uniref:Type ISP restriction-modification enzyme LLaBIII C-terminal specificity domain-containing protein n=1 Tax=bioreactor metagenome TaxID=1076179 RepID=A0A645A6W0_9ZZZZ
MPALYRPFTKKYLYFDDFWNEEQYQLNKIFTEENEYENIVICFPAIGGRTKYWCFSTKIIPNLTLTSVDGTQCIPFYIKAEEGTRQSENITDWALKEYQEHYSDPKITKWDIFYYVYGLLHAPGYRTKYAANLRRELPRIPFAPNFRAFSEAGKQLADLHVNYESQPEYPLGMQEAPGKPLNWRVQKMKLSPDKTAVIYNDFLTLTGVPLQVYDYKLGNRSALEWIIDQYRVKTDPRSGITNDPNNPEDEQYIVRLIKKIVTVSLETVKIVNSLPAEFE